MAAGHLLPLRGQNEHSTDPLDKLSGGEKLVRCVFQSACVGEVQYHLIDAAELWQSEMAAQFMALLGGESLPAEETGYPLFCGLRSGKCSSAAADGRQWSR